MVLPFSPSSTLFHAPSFSDALMTNAAATDLVGAAPRADDRTDSQPPLPPARSLAYTQIPPAAKLRIPFQWKVANLTGDAAAHNTDNLSSSATLAKVTAPYRFAELVEAEIEFAPLAGSFSKPLSISVVWTIASLSPATTTESLYYGGRIITVGGPVLMSSTTRVPADLSRLNPVIKGPVALLDTPRFSYTSYPNGGAAATDLVTVLVRGVLEVSGPSGNLIA